MLVVSDTSPVLNRAIIGHLHLLRQQFGKVWVPQAVIDELRIKQDLPGSAAVREAWQAGWLGSERVRDRVRVAILQRDLDPGESEASALALQKRADWLLLGRGRRGSQADGLWYGGRSRARLGAVGAPRAGANKTAALMNAFRAPRFIALAFLVPGRV